LVTPGDPPPPRLVRVREHRRGARLHPDPLHLRGQPPLPPPPPRQGRHLVILQSRPPAPPRHRPQPEDRHPPPPLLRAASRPVRRATLLPAPGSGHRTYGRPARPASFHPDARSQNPRPTPGRQRKSRRLITRGSIPSTRPRLHAADFF